MKKRLFLIPILIFSLNLTGCTRDNVNDDVTTRNRKSTDRNNITNVRNDNRNNVIGDNHSELRVADKAADKVTDLPEVGQCKYHRNR